jgi:hypothetical protein
MANLVFIDDEHKYTVDGEEVPSVSEVTRFMARELYGDVNQIALDAAAERGTKVHKATEALDKYGSVEIDDALVGYLKAYVSYVKEHKPSWEKIEWSVHNEKLYAGTIDRYGTVDEKRKIVDLKTTGTISPCHRAVYTAAQNLYRLAIEKEHPVDAIDIVQLKSDGTYKVWELEVQDTLAMACLALHQAMKKQKRKRKEKENDQG